MGMKPITKRKRSKRLTLHKKYKILANIREHHRKLRREAKKHGGKTKLTKDPGVPRMHPLKDELLRQAQAERARVEEEKKRKREARLTLQNANRDLNPLGELLENAEKRVNKFDKVDALGKGEEEVQYNIEGPSESSRKTFYREFQKVVESADVILQVLDARDPLGCRSADVERAIMEAGPRKRLVLVLNKVDLVPREIVEKWLKYLRNEFPTIAFKASTQHQGKLSHAKKDSYGSEGGMGAEAHGAGVLLKLLNNYCRNLNIKTSISVGVVGYPNVGKSSIINSLKRSKACHVGGTPGVTKMVQEVVLDKHIKLLDSPGIVLSKSSASSDLILRNAVKVEQIADPVPAVEAILRRCNKYQVMEKYSIGEYSTTAQFLQHMARRFGKLKKGGIPDLAAAAKILLNDWNSGSISFYTHPPEAHTLPAHLSASLVATYSQEFSMEEFERGQEEASMMAELTSMENFRGMELSSAKLEQAAMNDDTPPAKGKGMDKGRKKGSVHVERPGDDASEDGSEGEDGEDVQSMADNDLVDHFVTSLKKGAKRGQGALPRKAVGDDEDKLNPRFNKSLKQIRKQQKKTDKRHEARMKAIAATHDQPAYDFKSDFAPL